MVQIAQDDQRIYRLRYSDGRGPDGDPSANSTEFHRSISLQAHLSPPHDDYGDKDRACEVVGL